MFAEPSGFFRSLNPELDSTFKNLKLDWTSDKMAFQYSHHRPLTPITPAHSPHPSLGSIRTRTPGQLSLHDYRKQQVTPSPPAIHGQKTVKRKFAASSLKKIERIPPDSPNAPLLAPDHFDSTPPLTPSLESSPPHLQASLPQSFQTGTFTQFFPELAYLASTDLDISPPQSPSLLNLPPSESLLPNLLPSPTTTQTRQSFFSSSRPRPQDSSHVHSRPHSDLHDVSGQLRRLVEVTNKYLNSQDSRELERRASKRGHQRAQREQETTVPLLSGSGLPFGVHGGSTRQVSPVWSSVPGWDWGRVKQSTGAERRPQDGRRLDAKHGRVQDQSLQAQQLSVIPSTVIVIIEWLNLTLPCSSHSVRLADLSQAAQAHQK